jgi:regulator of replication initiation timing
MTIEINSITDMSGNGTRFDKEIQRLRKEISAFSDHNNQLSVRNKGLMKENAELRELLSKSSRQAPAINRGDSELFNDDSQ